MKGKKCIVSASLLALAGVVLLSAFMVSGCTPAPTTQTTADSFPSDGPSAPVEPSVPSEPTTSADPSVPTEPSKPSEPVVPDQTQPSQPDDPVEEPEKLWKTEIQVTRKDGSAAKGAAVIAAHKNGRQEYEPADENGVATLYLTEGTHSLRIFCDGESADGEVVVNSSAQKKSVQLEDRRKLYIYMCAAGAYEGDPEELASFEIMAKAIREKYPQGEYLTQENRYNVEFRDGDVLLTVKVFVEKYTSNDLYFASELVIDMRTYQECVTVSDAGDAGDVVETEYFDGSVYQIKIRNDYDYDYQDSVSVITESYYFVQKDWYLGRYSCNADSWSYGYTMDDIWSNSVEQKIKAPGAGMKTESFWTDINGSRYQGYCGYAEQIFPAVDLWFSSEWNQQIDQLLSHQ